jgi:hypothetical protein
MDCKHRDIGTEYPELAVTFQTSSREIVSSIPARVTVCRHWWYEYCWAPPGEYRVSTLDFPPNAFQFSYHPTFRRSMIQLCTERPWEKNDNILVKIKSLDRRMKHVA